jgi:hypothetical protein
VKIPTSDRLDAYFAHVFSKNMPALRVWTATEYGEFCAAVEDAVHMALLEIEAGAREYSVLGERALTLMLAQLLTAASVPAVSEGYHNGHVDVIIRHPAELPLSILGECKIYDGFEYHCKGCEQLLKRYSSGRSPRVLCVDFFRKPAMYEKLDELRAEFDARRPLNQQGGPTTHSIKGAFVTAHIHFTASTVEVLHLGCNVFHPDMRAKSLEEDAAAAATEVP